MTTGYPANILPAATNLDNGDISHDSTMIENEDMCTVNEA